ncbi:MAG TPA: hypothetical protein VG944_08405, partial [Fimbriimonas sp.]|nr:hypothetical protein [Fimbriimonas sp.]
PMGSITKHEVTHISLANGSLMAQSHQDAGAEQGKGYTIVILEEISRYRGASKFWGQACLVTQGAPGTFGGWVCGIANPSTNEDWRQVKEMVKPRVLLGLDKS